MATGKGVGEYLEYDLKGLKQIPILLKRIERAGGRVDVPLKKWGIYQIAQTAKTFQDEGRGKVKWPKLHEVTKIMRKYRKRGSGRTGQMKALQDTGHLKRSIKQLTYKQGKTQVELVYTKVPYAKTHQEGGKMKIPARTIVAKKAKALAFTIGSARSGGGHFIFAKKVEQPAREAIVPMRKFLFITDKDKRKALGLTKQHADKVEKNFNKGKR